MDICSNRTTKRVSEEAMRLKLIFCSLLFSILGFILGKMKSEKLQNSRDFPTGVVGDVYIKSKDYKDHKKFWIGNDSGRYELMGSMSQKGLQTVSWITDVNGKPEVLTWNYESKDELSNQRMSDSKFRFIVPN